MEYNTTSGTFPVDLSRLGLDYYNQYAQQIRAALVQGGAKPATVEAVLQDYKFACCGGYFPGAAPADIAAALVALRSVKVKELDTGVLWIVFAVYTMFLAFWRGYEKDLHGEAADVETKRKYFSIKRLSTPWREVFPAFLFWLRFHSQIRPDDFAGLGSDEIAAVLDWINADGPACSFAFYVYIAREIIGATPEQVEQLTPPPLFRDIADALAVGKDSIAYIKDVEERAYKNYQEFRESARRNSPEPDETEPEIVETEPETVETEPEQIDALAYTISQRLASLNSRGQWLTFEAKKDGDIVRKKFPVNQRIQEYARSHPDAATFTEYTLHRVIKGLNSLRILRNVTPVEGYYHLTTTINEFSTLCGFDQPNAVTLAQIRAALDFWRDLYAVIWTPRGQVAMKVIIISKIGLSGEMRGKFEILTPEYAMAGTQIFISLEEQQKIDKLQKSAPGIRFANQILTKGHKKENTMTEEIFAYDTALATVEENLDFAKREGRKEDLEKAISEKAAIRELQRKHKARDRNSLKKMFEQAAADGLITYTREKNAAGEFVYTWKRLKPDAVQQGTDADL